MTDSNNYILYGIRNHFKVTGNDVFGFSQSIMNIALVSQIF